jgi:HSP20 family protein
MTHYELQAWNPLREFDRWFNGAGYAPAGFAPSADVEETPTHFLLTLDVPGVPRDDLKIEVREDQLSITGKRRGEAFQRAFRLPAQVDAHGIEAELRDGVLTVALPKAEEAKPRQITVGEAKGPGLLSRLLERKPGTAA